MPDNITAANEQKIKIAYVAAGAAGMYCGSCLHDNALAAALMRQGHEVALIPTYTPIRTDETDVSTGRVFFGGINIYLQHRFALFRHTPRFIDRLFDRPALLNWVSRFTASTDARELGELTLSTLQGEAGNLRKEVERLSSWLQADYRPDIVQLTNSMFSGMARQLKHDLDVPVLCAMQGEDLFLDGLIEPYRSRAMALLRERAKEIDGFIATSDYYADFMVDYLQVPADRIHVVRLGIKLDGHGERPREVAEQHYTIGYLARICPEKGLHLLVEAFALMQKEPLPRPLRLQIAGYLGKRDEAYFRGVNERIRALGLAEQVDYLGEINRDAKIDFLNSIDVLSVPTVYREPKGLFALEALANGTPLVLPDHGAFPEMIEMTGGGVLVEPESPQALAGGLRSLLLDGEKRQRMGAAGKAAVKRLFSDDAMATATAELYSHYLQNVPVRPTVATKREARLVNVHK